MASISVTLLAENTAKDRGIRGEHGLAYWIETPEGPILFDTGQGLVLEDNAKALGIDLGKAKAIVLSHGHYDHVGGLPGVLQFLPDVPVYCHPEVVRKRYSRGKNASVHSVNSTYLTDAFQRERGKSIRWMEGPTSILGGVFATGEVPRRNDWEDVGGAFFLDEECTQPDFIRDDQSLYFEGANGVVLILGCAHAGVINTMEHVMEISGNGTIHTVFGGMHLLHAGEERIARTGAAFEAYGVERMGPCHCTGVGAVSAFRNRFPLQFEEIYAGKTVRFE